MKRKFLLFGLLFVLMFHVAWAQEQTVGVMFGDHEGYTLFRSAATKDVYLIDGQGRVVNQWTVSGRGRDAFLRENGSLVVTVQRHNPDPMANIVDVPFVTTDGRFEEYTWDGELVWSYEFNRPNYRVHHGVEVLPNGNIIFIAYEVKASIDVVAAGRNPEQIGDEGLWTEVYLEYSPQLDEIVWEWHPWDHLVQDFDPTKDNFGRVADSPQLIDINFPEQRSERRDWLHSNAVSYNSELDQLAISAREFNEVWIVDHSIATEEARGEAGDLLYRWGNPSSYHRGDENDHHIFYQHDVQWIPEGRPGSGNIIMYSNRHSFIPDGGSEDNAINFSRVVEFTPPIQADGTYALEEGQAFGPAQPTWTYDGLPDNRFFSNFISGVHRLSDGNTLVTSGNESVMFEVTPDGEVIWEYRPPLRADLLVQQGSQAATSIFRSRRYHPAYPAFEGRDLTPGLTIQEIASSSPEFPASVLFDEKIQGRLTHDIEQRYYAFVAENNEIVTATIDALDDVLDPHLTLLTSEFETLIEDDNSGDGQNALIQRFRIPLGGTYYLIVRDASRDEIAIESHFELSLVNEGIAFESIDETIPRLLYGTTVPDSFSPNDASSVYVFWGVEGEQVSIHMVLNSEALTPMLELQNVEQQVLVVGDADDDGLSINAFTLPYTGVYYIFAAHNGAPEVSGSFDLTLLVDDTL